MGKLDTDFFENIIIYNLLTDELYLGTIVDALEPKYFTNKNISKIVALITEFYLSRNSPPTVTELKAKLDTNELKETFKGVVKSFEDIDKKYNKEELYENTEEFIKQKAVYHTMLETADKCQAGHVDTGQILEHFTKACTINISGGIGLNYFSDIDVCIEDLKKEEAYISSRWEWLDRKLNGGFLETGKSLYLIAGATNVGKSIFLGNIATNVASQGKTVVVVSLEMSELMYAKRLSTSITQIPINTLHTSPDDVKQKIVSYKTTHPDSRLIIKEFPPNSITASHLNGYLQKLTHQGIKPDMVVLDYINLLHCPMGNNSYERVKHAAEQVRALSYTFGCPFVTATQINRGGLNEQNPGVESISESIGLAATADVIMSIWQDEGDVDLGVIRMGMVKNRYGQNYGTTALAIDYATLTLTQADAIINTEEADDVDLAFGMIDEDN